MNVFMLLSRLSLNPVLSPIKTELPVFLNSSRFRFILSTSLFKPLIPVKILNNSGIYSGANGRLYSFFTGIKGLNKEVLRINETDLNLKIQAILFYW